MAGSDCSGGAGIQADLKAFSANETFGMSVITSVVAENTTRVLSVFNVPVEEIQKQIDAVFEDIHVDAVKLGMLPTAEIISAVADKLNEYKPSIIVCDPVMVATSGDALSEGGTVSTMREKLFPIVTLLTPNIPEAEAISGLEIKNENHMPNTHGTGCTLSSAITANLAHGMDMLSAVTKAKNYITEAIEKSFTVGKGHSPVNHFYDYYDLKGTIL